MIAEAPHLTLPDLQKVEAGAFFRPRDAMAAGLSYYDLQKLVERGEVEQVSRGLYRLSDVEPTENYTLAAVSARVPNAVICLLSALQYHRIGTSLPRHVWIAIPHKARPPRLPDFPVRIVRFSGAAAEYGIDEVQLEGVPTLVTNIARTVVDCFRYHRLISRETALEALREVIQQGRTSPDSLWRAADDLGARTLIGPLVEAFSV